MLLGGSGCGKTTVMRSILKSLDRDLYSTRTMSLCHYTSSASLQKMLEGCIEKKAGTRFGPHRGKRMVFFLDDINAPAVDAYGTQDSIALLKQHLGYGFWYHRQI